jgi:hypothetical protein
MIIKTVTLPVWVVKKSIGALFGIIGLLFKMVFGLIRFLFTRKIGTIAILGLGFFLGKRCLDRAKRS